MHSANERSFFYIVGFVLVFNGGKKTIVSDFNESNFQQCYIPNSCGFGEFSKNGKYLLNSELNWFLL